MTSELAFTPGDLLQTEPKPGYWGCAVVLTAFPRTPEFHPRFHVGITPIILRHQYDLTEIDTADLSILTFSRQIRVAPFEYATLPEQVCVGIYTARSQAGIRVLGRVDPAAVYSAPLTLDIGNGTAGDFPLCGPLRSNIGSEAVVAWRRAHDAEALERECETAREQFEAFESERLAKQREAAQRRKCKDA